MYRYGILNTPAFTLKLNICKSASVLNLFRKKLRFCSNVLLLYAIVTCKLVLLKSNLIIDKIFRSTGEHCKNLMLAIDCQLTLYVENQCLF